MPELEVQWQAPEFEYREKHISWYWGSIFFAVAILGFAVWQKNFLFSFFIIIGEILVLVWAGHRPKIQTFKISEKGLEIVGQKMYPWNDLDTFSVDENADGENSRFIFRFKKTFRTTLAIGVSKNQREKIREQLESFLSRTEYEPSLIDGLEKLFGF